MCQLYSLYYVQDGQSKWHGHILLRALEISKGPRNEGLGEAKGIREEEPVQIARSWLSLAKLQTISLSQVTCGHCSRLWSGANEDIEPWLGRFAPDRASQLVNATLKQQLGLKDKH